MPGVTDEKKRKTEVETLAFPASILNNFSISFHTQLYLHHQIKNLMDFVLTVFTVY